MCVSNNTYNIFTNHFEKGGQEMMMDIEQAQDLAEINHLKEEVAKLRKENEDLKKILWAVADKVKDFKKEDKKDGKI